MTVCGLKKSQQRPSSRQTSSANPPPGQASQPGSCVRSDLAIAEAFSIGFPSQSVPQGSAQGRHSQDAEQHLELLGLTREQLKLGISTWCRGTRYWASLVENAPRLDLGGQAVGTVTATQAKQQASRQRVQDRKNRAKLKRMSRHQSKADRVCGPLTRNATPSVASAM